MENDILASAAAAESPSQSSDVKLAEQEFNDKYTDGQRSAEYKHIIHWSAKISISIVGVLVISAALIVFYHHITPLNWQWLPKDEIGNLQNILLSSVIGSQATSYFRRHKIR